MRAFGVHASKRDDREPRFFREKPESDTAERRRPGMGASREDR